MYGPMYGPMEERVNNLKMSQFLPFNLWQCPEFYIIAIHTSYMK